MRREQGRDAAGSPGRGRETIPDAQTRPGRSRRAPGKSESERGRAPAHPLTTYQRYFIHGALVVLAVAAAVLALAGPIAGGGKDDLRTLALERVEDSADGYYLRPPAALATLPGVPVRLAAASEPTASPTATPTPEPTPTPTPEPEPAYATYTIQPGDSVASISAAFGIAPESIFWNNPEVGDDPNFVIAGQELLIPAVDGIIYRVKLGDTLFDVAMFYGITVDAIVGFAPNRLVAPDSVIEGMTLVLPGAVPPPPPPPPTPTPAPPPPPPEEEPPPPPPSSVYIWPFQGSITSPFGEPRGSGVYHEGIDIEGIGQEGAPVLAAAAGQVVLADTHPGYGNYVIIRHPNGSETWYAHLSRIDVGYGQFVEQGQVVGGIGHTGYVFGIDGNHLHFEIRIGGVPVDPLLYLP